MANYNKVFPVKIYNKYYWIQRIIVATLYKLMFRCKVVGRENIDFNDTFLILSNHCSYVDPPLVGHAVPKPIAYMTKSTLFNIPVLDKIMYWSGAFAVDKKGGDNYLENTKYALDNGWLVTIFPEGGRSTDGNMKELRMGAAKILLHTKKPFLPVSLTNTHYFLGKVKMKLFKKVTVNIGKMVYPEDYLLKGDNVTLEEQTKHIAELYAQKIFDLLPEHQKPEKPTIRLSKKA